MWASAAFINNRYYEANLSKIMNIQDLPELPSPFRFKNKQPMATCNQKEAATPVAGCSGTQDHQEFIRFIAPKGWER